LKGGKAMFRFKIFSVISVLLFVFGIAVIDCAMAGEKIKAHGASFMTDWKQIEVGDEDGHVIAVFKSKLLLIDDKTGEKAPSTAVHSLDMNLKTGMGTMTGCGWTPDKDGDKIIRTFEGKPAGKGHWRGTWTYVKGTGKYEGIKGTGTWDSYSMGKGQPSYMEVEGEVEMPTK
jgi:hypothetical protein